VVAAVLYSDAKAILSDHWQGDSDSGGRHHLQAINRSIQGEDGSLAGGGCCSSRSQTALQEKAVGEKDPSAALNLLQSQRVKTGFDPGNRDLKACYRISDYFWHRCL
jgi:hypothetical protein